MASRWISPAGRKRGGWLEPACGTGRYLRIASRRGHDVTGFDREERLVAYARKHLPQRRARLFTATMESFAAGIRGGSIGFAFTTASTIRHLDSDRAVTRHLDEMRRVLSPGGIYAVGLSLLRKDRRAITEDFWTGARGRVRVSQLVQYVPPGVDSPPRVETLIHHLTVERPDGVEHFDFTDRLRTYDRAQWNAVVAEAGWAVREVVDGSGDPVNPDAFDEAFHLLVPQARKRAIRTGRRPPRP